MTPQEFIEKWRNVKLTERSAAQQHFLDLCALVEHPTPAAVDKTGETFTFERGVAKGGSGLGADGRNGWADVWKKGCFAWEYKGPHKDLAKAYAQLQQYREDLENPPLLVVSDMDRIVIHTNFTATPVEVHEIPLADIGAPENLEKLRALFHHPEKLRPGLTSEHITAKAAGRLAELAQSLRNRDYEAHEVARFLDRIVFCLFAEDIALLPEKLFTRLLEKTCEQPDRFAKYAQDLFEAMATGGDFNFEDIRHFNGNLFADCTVLELTTEELSMLHSAACLDWSAIDPSIFGTLFERGMDPSKRSQLGAHYTSRDDIETLIEPVVMLPLRREWYEARTAVEHLLNTGRKPPKPLLAQAREAATRRSSHFSVLSSENDESGRGFHAASADSRSSCFSVPPSRRSSCFSMLPEIPPPQKLSDRSRKRARNEATTILTRFHDRVSRVKVLDPACGSGNFLYVTLQKLKDIEKEVILFAQDKLNESFLPQVGPWQLYGIELNPYAFDLAQMTVWIGYLQWTRANGFGITQDPILRTMNQNFQCKDAILEWDRGSTGGSTGGGAGGGAAPTPPLEDHGPSKPPISAASPESQAIRAEPAEPEWPRVDFIVGNPPFLGGSKLWSELGREYQKQLYALYHDRVPGFADLCCYWFEKARKQIAEGKAKRAGLLATQGIRGGANRKVLERIKTDGDIFFAESDRPWILDGANVHVSMVGFDDGEEEIRLLDGQQAVQINANLTSSADITEAKRLPENTEIAFIGTKKAGEFNVPEGQAMEWCSMPNPHGKPNSDLLRPWCNGSRITKRADQQWIIDTGTDLKLEQFSYYQAPFEFACENVKPAREKNNRQRYRDYWWLHAETRPGMRAVIENLSRYVATPRVSKHRVFVWLSEEVLCDDGVFVFARSDDYFFGILHSRIHETWARAQGTQLRERASGFRYTPTSCFETFPFPWPPGKESQDDPLVREIADAAKTLCELRDNWLNPPEWTATETLEFPGTVGGPWDRYIDPETTRDITVPGGETIQVGTVNYPRTVPKDEASAKKLKKRTLTNLYNENPAWLQHAHQTLDTAVAHAYAQTTGDKAWAPDMPEEQILEKLLALNLERAKR